MSRVLAPPGKVTRRPKTSILEPAPQEVAGPAENRTPSTAVHVTGEYAGGVW
jgi:hypothetical protein